METTTYVVNIWDIQWDAEEPEETEASVYWGGELPETIQEYEVDFDGDDVLTHSEMEQVLMDLMREDYGADPIDFRYEIVYTA